MNPPAGLAGSGTCDAGREAEARSAEVAHLTQELGLEARFLHWEREIP